eukprot:168828-Prymnesium_polylepis.1
MACEARARGSVSGRFRRIERQCPHRLRGAAAAQARAVCGWVPTCARRPRQPPLAPPPRSQ